MDADEQAEFEALFTDEYWEQMRQEMIEFLKDVKNLRQMLEEVRGEESERRTEVRETLHNTLIRDAGKRPAYLTNVTSDMKELLRRIYEERLADAKRCAQDIGTCHACGSTNLVGSVGTTLSKFKICVRCNDCDALIVWS
jgi:FMN phosphatase YigB (HAD superfamily)